MFASSCFTLLSRSWLLIIFACQYSVLDFGITNSPHPSCPCQKHPFTKMHVLYFLSTMSGFPGNLGWLSLYLKPRLHKNLRTSISGFVSFPFIEAMHLCLCSGVSLSIVVWGGRGGDLPSCYAISFILAKCITLPGIGSIMFHRICICQRVPRFLYSHLFNVTRPK